MFHRRSWQELVKHTETICRQIAKEFFQHHTKWSNTLKQFAVKVPANVLSVVDHFVGFTEFSRAFWVPLNAQFSKWQTNSGYVVLRIDCLYLFWKRPGFLEMQIHNLYWDFL